MMDSESGYEGPPRRTLTLTRDHVWPLGIAIALLIVIAVNVTFIVIAVRGQDEIAQSYVEGER